MRKLRSLFAVLGAILCLAGTGIAVAAEGCPDLAGKDPEAHLQYLQHDRSTLTAKCIVTAITYLSGKRYAPASAVVIQYLDFADPAAVARRDMILRVYPALDAAISIGKAVLPDLIAAIADGNTTELARENAVTAVNLIHGAHDAEAVGVLVRASRAQTDSGASGRLLEQARSLAAKCPPGSRGACEDALRK